VADVTETEVGRPRSESDGLIRDKNDCTTKNILKLVLLPALLWPGIALKTLLPWGSPGRIVTNREFNQTSI